MFGCPAEETTSGKIPMAAEGLFNRADVGFQMHPGANGIGSYTLALNLMDFTFTGKASHAASAPWEGRSALDGIMMLFNGIEYLREHVKPDVRIHGIVTDGGQAANIVPETASARFYVRSEERSYLDTVVKRVHAIAEAAAIATETQLTITPIKQYDNVVNVPGFMKLVQDVAKDYVGLDMPFATPGGAAASTDFGTASSSIPCVMFGLSPVPKAPCPVTPAMVEAVSSGMVLRPPLSHEDHGGCGLRIIHNPELLEAIRAEWEVVKAGSVPRLRRRPASAPARS